MHSYDITYRGLIFCFSLLLIPIVLCYFFKIKLINKIIVSAIRMTGQLFLAGIILIYLFEFNNMWLNLFWVSIMIIFASLTTLNSTRLKLKKFFIPVLISLIITNLSIIFYFNKFIADLKNIFDVKFFVVVGGMMIGNSLKGNIIGINNFYNQLEKAKKNYIYKLSLGATLFETIKPYFKNSIKSAVQPTVASMATLGIVFLPGMMTGQILGGVSPVNAIKYQLAIMCAIFTSTFLSVILTIIFSLKTGFNSYGLLENNIFKKSE